MKHGSRSFGTMTLSLAMLALLTVLSLPAQAQRATPIVDVENPARTAFWASAIVTVNVGFVGVLGSPLATIPEGRRLVVEHASVRCTTPSGSPLVRSTLSVTERTSPSSAFFRQFEVPISQQGVDPFSGPTFVGSLATRIYSDPGLAGGAAVTLGLIRAAGAGTMSCTVSISGHTIGL